MKLYEKKIELMKNGYHELNSSRGVVTMVNEKLEVVIIKSKKGIFTEYGKGLVGQETKERYQALKDNLENGDTFNQAMAHVLF